jgi:dephospho-CoA kinase
VAKIYKNPEKKFITYLRTIGLSKSISKKNINKKIISKIVFENKQIRKKLELYIFKIVRKKRSDFIKQEKQKKTRLIFIDIPLLFENNLEKQFNKVISIIASKRVRLKRLKKTRKMTENQFKNITRSQTSDVIRKKKSDYVIYNNSTLKDYKIKINKLISKL